MIHVALKLRGDVLSHPAYEGVDVGEQAAIECVPDSLYMFLNMMIGGQRLIEQDIDEDHDDSKDRGVRTTMPDP